MKGGGGACEQVHRPAIRIARQHNDEYKSAERVMLAFLPIVGFALAATLVFLWLYVG